MKSKTSHTKSCRLNFPQLLKSLLTVAVIFIYTISSLKTATAGGPLCTERTSHSVDVSDFQFTPQNLAIVLGDTVVWTNTGGFHNVNGSTATFPANPESFFSGAAASAPWVFSHIFTTIGSYDYRCDIHFSMGMTGTITVAPEISCDDGDACTIDGCDPLVGCIYFALDCDDGDACTIDGCDFIAGCYHFPDPLCNNPCDTLICNDNDACTIDDCAGGVCANTPVNCDDLDACTDDVCYALSGCISIPISCNDGDDCTIVDYCDALSGCLYYPLNCSDADPCTLDRCAGGLCINSPTSCICDTLICNDSNVCTTDNCVPATGCVFTPIAACNDNDVCTTDNCVPSTGCVFTAIVCNDGNQCTTDTCINGQCVFTTLVPAPEICIVGVDSATHKNIIVWEKPVTTVIDSYLIYRETSQTNVYAIIGAQTYGEFSTFIDQQSIPEQNSNKYKLGVADICGQTTSGILYHKTIHLSINQGVGNSWNLSWNHYEGFSFSTYNIYRGTTPANLTLLNSTASNNDSYSDLNPPAGNVIYYQIEVINPNTCNPSARMGNYSSSRSNIANTSSVGMDETESSSLLKMYPNPFNSSITIEMPDLADSPFEFTLFDITGKKLLTEQNMRADRFILKRNNLMQGIYYAELRGVKNIYRGKIIAF